MVSLRSLVTALFLLMASGLFACTNLIVGKDASVDGSVICTYNSDAFCFAGHMEHFPNGSHAKGEKVAVPTYWHSDTGKYIEQVEYTYNMVAMMNEKQVTITETTFDGRLELADEESLIDYYCLIQLGLQRSANAREAIRIMGSLAETYGYSSSGETFSVCDKNEAWIMEIMGKGKGGKGAVWVAVRVPDDCVCAHANLSRIRQFPQTKKFDKKLGCYIVQNGKIDVEGEMSTTDVMYSKDVISFARQKGFFDGKDEEFSFRDAYCPIDFENVRYADARVYSFFRHHYSKETIDKYLPYINGNFDECDHLPLWIRPVKKLSVREVMNDMRDHFEGTPLDMTADVSAGPYASPYRPLPMNYQGEDGNSYFRERPIACQQTAYTMVCQMRSWLDDELGGICYFNLDDANVVAYVPVYACSTRVPACFRDENNPQSEFSTESAFWMNNFVGNMVYPRYSVMIGDLRDAQKELEDFYEADQQNVINTTQSMTYDNRVKYLTEKSAEYADMMMKRWDKLARFLIVKHNDQVQRPSKDGQITDGRMGREGYTKEYNEVIIKETGERYRLKKLIERRMR